jgi:peptidoglycan/xylan/chitin deacetylase (PgdA/CDA1 family)
MLRRLVKMAAAAALHWSGAARRVADNAPLVLSYHRVVDDFPAHERHSMPPMLISTKMLERQLDWIGRHYQFVTLDELASAVQTEKRFSRRPVAAVTFDDGYDDVYVHGFPLLRRKGIPSAVFVVTDLLTKCDYQNHDRLYLLLQRRFAARGASPQALFALLKEYGVPVPAGKTLAARPGDYSQTVNFVLSTIPQSRVRQLMQRLENDSPLELDPAMFHRSLDWDNVLAMHRAGVVIGSHTRTHAVLTTEEPEKVRDEIDGSRQELEQKLGGPVRHFAYPDGRFDSSTIAAVAAAGYSFAYTTSRRTTSDYPLLTIPRCLLWERSCVDAFGRFSPALLDCIISGVFDASTYGARAHRAQNFLRTYAIDV